MTYLFLVLSILCDMLGIGSAQAYFDDLSTYERNVIIEDLEVEGRQANILNLDLKNFRTPPKRGAGIKPTLNLQAAVAIDNSTGTILFEQNADKVHPIASLTKVMTAIVVLENLELDEVVNVSSKAAYKPGSRTELLPGERITVRELLHGLLLESGNDAAAALEDHYNAKGKGNTFIDMMNIKAKLLSLEKTKYFCPSGWDEKNVSTPKETAAMIRYAMRNETFRFMIRRQKHTSVSTDGAISHPMINSNRLLRESPATYIAGKTGFNLEGKYNLVEVAKKGQNKIITATFGCGTNDGRFYETGRLTEWVFRTYKW